ncbi:MAG: CidA/LrgA family protein [Clostridiales bacterium]|nr:CidA/LrgA family protein [Clostridiales bacterium]
MKYIFQFGIIAAVSLIGELLYVILPLPVPASVYGLVLMFVLLCTGIIKLKWIEETADYLLMIMPLLFVEPSVKLMTSFGIIQGRILPLFLMCIVSWAVVMIITGSVAQFVIRMRKKKEKRTEEKTNG